MEAIDILWVGLGGGVGSVLRWQIGQYIKSRIKAQFDVGTFVINITGAFVIAYISALLAIGWEQRYGDFVSAFALTGMLGGYTTFSTMEVGAVQMATTQHQVVAVLYLLLSVVVGLLAAAAGVALATW